MDTAVNLALEDRVVAPLQVREKRCGDGSHPRAEHRRGFCPFELSNGALGNGESRIAVAGVKDISFRFFEGNLLVDVFRFEGRGQMDGCGDWSIRALSTRSRMDGSCRQAQILALHVISS